jgi:hypothetical protein
MFVWRDYVFLLFSTRVLLFLIFHFIFMLIHMWLTRWRCHQDFLDWFFLIIFSTWSIIMTSLTSHWKFMFMPRLIIWCHIKEVTITIRLFRLVLPHFYLFYLLYTTFRYTPLILPIFNSTGSQGRGTPRNGAGPLRIGNRNKIPRLKAIDEMPYTEEAMVEDETVRHDR